MTYTIEDFKTALDNQVRIHTGSGSALYYLNAIDFAQKELKKLKNSVEDEIKRLKALPTRLDAPENEPCIGNRIKELKKVLGEEKALEEQKVI